MTVMVMMVAIACGDTKPKVVLPDASSVIDAALGTCDPLTQAGCSAGQKCAWLIDALSPYAGHTDCVAAGAVDIGGTCRFGAPGASGYDNCIAGAVCTNYREGTGICATICDPTASACPSTTKCVNRPGLFATGAAIAAGLCAIECDPLDDNDFDGSGTMFTRAGTFCTTATSGCYGYPSFGTAPVTSWSCVTDINYGASLFHRVPCVYNFNDPLSCADAGPQIYINSCNQGHLPLLYEMTGSTTVVCTAICRPMSCYAGNCGPNDENRLGAVPHRCNGSDRMGTFDTSIGGEHCDYLWDYEVDQGAFLRSPTSDTVGFCFDHSKYRYDSDADNVPDRQLPACAELQLIGTGSAANDPTTYFGAVDLGCVSTPVAGLFTGKQLVRRGHFDRPRPLYGRSVSP